MASVTHSDGSKKNTNGGGTTSYDDFIELRKRILLKEKELLEKKKWSEKASVKNGGEEIAAKEQLEAQKGGKLMYRSFDEFYKYKKYFEEHEVKVERDAMKLLRKCGGSYLSGGNKVSGGNDVHTPNDVHAANDVHTPNEEGDRGDHRYSYIKLKTERQGTVKQLKEYFQKMQQEQMQKRNNEMLPKRDKKGTINVVDKGKERGLNSGNTVLEKVENEKRCYPPEDDLPTTLHSSAGGVSIPQGDTKGNNQVEKQPDGCANGANAQSDHIDMKELELLYNLISEMKKSRNKGEDYIANLVQDLHNSNKRHLVRKILQILKTVDSKITSEQGKKPLESGVSQVGAGDLGKQHTKVSTSLNMQCNKAFPEKEKTNGGHTKVLTKGTFNWSSVQKNEEKKTAPVRSGSPIHVKIKKYNDAVEAGYSQIGRPLCGKVEVRKVDGSVSRTVERKKGPTKGGKATDNENSGAKGALQGGKNNQKGVTPNDRMSKQTSIAPPDGANNQSKQPNENVTSLRPNGSTVKGEANHAGKFEWFYSTMKDLYSEGDGEAGGEPNGGPRGESNDYSSEDGENDDLFLWLENRDVENVLSGKKQSDEGNTSEE
ncbi:Uncharacterized protein PCOAH_00042710 [Plasmodium coatneyi]|uniref:Uncharacterized protein n=1 Tax=Plasmodium coatneyi TaxID=208452 RepID=A0A1B1E399_9APIC|nr:Uncharacterized protein PCOAH_00042710 [Plasmodium coatneyi]ANQ09484.1 Uncharacterized protein PCOAH_00042710 [Plasmodium coatneyi]